MLKWLTNKLNKKFGRQYWREMSIGEVVDKYTILVIKIEKLPRDKTSALYEQTAFIWDGVCNYARSFNNQEILKEFFELKDLLYRNNLVQWDYEDKVFSATNDKEGILAAKESRRLNLRRAEIKREIDLLFKEKYLEIKDYAKMKDL